MRTPKLIYGYDNGECELWDTTLGEYNLYRKRLDKLAHGTHADSKKYDELEKEFLSHQIIVDTEEYGYVPDFATYLAKVFKIDVDSN